MRTTAETLQERAPEELTIDNIELELIQNLHMQQENAASWVSGPAAPKLMHKRSFILRSQARDKVV